MKLFKRVITFLLPPDEWQFPVIITIGIFSGLLILVLHLGKADSYLSDNPEACINCHVMYPQYSSWMHSSHKRVANCNDCHIPHTNILRKLFFKAQDGLRHATIFTLRLEPQVILIKSGGKNVVQENCNRCHTGILSYHNSFLRFADITDDVYCWHCHRDTPHGRVNSLSSTPNTLSPKEK